MGMNMKEVGGGPATGLAEDLIAFLQGGLNTGSFGANTAQQRMNGANPIANTQGIAGALNDILMGGGGNFGGSIQEMVSRDVERNAANLRARHSAGGGGSYGSSAAFGEALLRSESAPRIAQAVTGAQMNLLGMLMPMMANLAGKGIAQRETVAEPNPWMQAAQIGTQLLGDGFNFFAGGNKIPGFGGGGNDWGFGEGDVAGKTWGKGGYPMIPNTPTMPGGSSNIYAGGFQGLPIIPLNVMGG